MYYGMQVSLSQEKWISVFALKKKKKSISKALLNKKKSMYI